MKQRQLFKQRQEQAVKNFQKFEKSRSVEKENMRKKAGEKAAAMERAFRESQYLEKQKKDTMLASMA